MRNTHELQCYCFHGLAQHWECECGSADRRYLIMRDDNSEGHSKDEKVPAKAEAREGRNFKETTRKNIERAAGGRCSIRRCLDLTSCRREKPNGQHGSASKGRAAHIYAASPYGPRPAPDGMTDAEISDFTNGIWACADCADIIDSHESLYSVESLKEMKSVREFTQQLIATDPTLQFLEKFMNAYTIDEIVWEHFPRPDRNSVLSALLAEGQKCFVNIPLVRVMPAAPQSFSLKSGAIAARSVLGTLSNVSQARQQVVHGAFKPDVVEELRQHATTILAGWTESMISRYWTQGGGIIHYCLVKLSARDPHTGDFSNAAILVQADAHGLYKHSIMEGEDLRLGILHSTSSVNDLDWRLSISFQDGKIKMSSTLRRFGLIRPHDIGNPYEWADFESYCEVLECLALGWTPVGFISSIAGGSENAKGLRTKPFRIALSITPDELNDALARCKKVRLARELQEKWRKPFVFTEEFFDTELDVATIQQASNELFNCLVVPCWTRGHSDVLFTNGVRDVRLNVSDRDVRVKSFQKHL